MNSKIFELPLIELQPSQLYISEAKLAAVRIWFNPVDKSKFVPIPIKRFKGKYMMTDGHTRAVQAVLAGWKNVPVIWDIDELDMAAYAECVRWCEAAEIKSAVDLIRFIVSAEEYINLWDSRCDELHRSIKSG